MAIGPRGQRGIRPGERPARTPHELVRRSHGCRSAWCSARHGPASPARCAGRLPLEQVGGHGVAQSVGSDIRASGTARIDSCTTRRTTRWLMRPPRVPRNSALADAGATHWSRTARQASMALSPGSPSGTIRSLSPFPITRTRPRARRGRPHRGHSSLTRRPEPYSVSRMATSRRPRTPPASAAAAAAASISSRTSVWVRVWGRRRPSLGERSPAAGSVPRRPVSRAQPKKTWRCRRGAPPWQGPRSPAGRPTSGAGP